LGHFSFKKILCRVCSAPTSPPPLFPFFFCHLQVIKICQKKNWDLFSKYDDFSFFSPLSMATLGPFSKKKSFVRFTLPFFCYFFVWKWSKFAKKFHHLDWQYQGWYVMVHPMPQQINVSMCASLIQFLKSQKWQNTFYLRQHNLQVWKNVLIPNFFPQSRRLVHEGGPLFSFWGFLWAWSFVNGLQDLRACSGHTYFLQFLERVWPRQGGWPTREIYKIRPEWTTQGRIKLQLRTSTLWLFMVILMTDSCTFQSPFFIVVSVLRYSRHTSSCDGLYCRFPF
jgi:hypothetical protein